MTTVAVFALLLSASAPDAPHVDAALCDTAGATDVVDHDVALTVTLDPPSLTGAGTVTILTRSSGEVVALDAKGLTVEQVSVGGARASHVTAGDKLCVRLRARVPPGTRVPLQLRWRARTDGETPRFTSDQGWAGYSTSAWMPTVQDSAQRATLTLRLMVPPGLRVAASGARQERAPGPDGQVVHRFTISRPTPPFLYAFAVGRFQEASLHVRDVNLRVLGPVGAG